MIKRSSLVATLLACVLSANAASLQLSQGSGEFEITGDPAVPEGRLMRVLYHAPSKIDAETRVWFVIHGANRNPDSYRNGWTDHVKDDNVLLLLPEFTRENFPGASSFNLGNVRQGNGQRPEAQWSFSTIERVFDHVRDNAGVEAEDYLIYGHSAGSQFTHRMLLFRPETRARAAFVANAGWYTMPDRSIDFPFGLGGVQVTDERLRQVLAMPVVVLLGDQDTDAEHQQLSQTEGAMAQGPHRFARGHSFFEAAQARAEQMNVPFGWSLEIVEGVAHSNKGMAVAAARAMRGF